MSTEDQQNSSLPIVLSLVLVLIVLLVVGLVCGVTGFVLTVATTVDSQKTESALLLNEVSSDLISPEESEQEAIPTPTLAPTQTPDVAELAEIDTTIRGKLVIVDEALVVVEGIGRNSAEPTFDLPNQPLYTRYLFPAWSPDGEMIASIGTRGPQSGVYLVNPDGESDYQNIHPEGEGAPIYLSWSPDGGIGYIANGQSGIDLWFREELVLEGEESNTQQILSGTPFFWDWTGEQNEILAHIGSPTDENYLQFLDLTDIEQEDLTTSANLSADGFYQSPSISHDESYFAYAETNGNIRTIIIHSTITNRRVFTSHTGFAAMAWSPTDNPTRLHQLNLTPQSHLLWQTPPHGHRRQRRKPRQQPRPRILLVT